MRDDYSFGAPEERVATAKMEDRGTLIKMNWRNENKEGETATEEGRVVIRKDAENHTAVTSGPVMVADVDYASTGVAFSRLGGRWWRLACIFACVSVDTHRGPPACLHDAGLRK